MKRNGGNLHTPTVEFQVRRKFSDGSQKRGKAVLEEDLTLSTCSSSLKRSDQRARGWNSWLPFFFFPSGKAASSPD